MGRCSRLCRTGSGVIGRRGQASDRRGDANCRAAARQHTAVARASYVSPAVIEQYLDGRTIDDFRPRQLRVVGARDTGLDPEERATLSLLRSWNARAREVA